MILPPPEIVEQAYVKNYEKLYQQSIDDPEAFWENIAQELLWFKPWNKVLQWQWPYARWFVGGQTNIVYNCLDRWMKTPKADKLALIWEGQDGQVRKFTYRQLNEEVGRFANALKSLGLKKGDHVTIYLPRIPEQDIAMLACAKIGLVHSVVFSGFSIEALKNRIQDAGAKVVICANGYPYKDKVIDSLTTVKEAIKDCPTVKNIIVVKRLESTNQIFGQNESQSLSKKDNLTPSYPSDISKENQSVCRYHWWHELVAPQDTLCSTEIMESTDPLYILYTSGSTGKPKGVVHGHGGYMVGTYLTLKWVFNLQEDDIYWCTADAGWVTGHSYIVYSPLLNGITTFIYESVPDYPHPGKWWSLIEKYKVTKFYTAPTAIRAAMRYGEEWPKKYDLSSLKILGSVGEPINPEAWLWYWKHIGREKCPVMDTWWQTETGMFILTPFPSTPLKAGSCFKPFFGIKADVVDEKGNSLAPSNAPPTTCQVVDGLAPGAKNEQKQGFLVIKTPWPAMLLDIYNNPQKYRETYFEKIPPSSTKNENNQFADFLYFTGDSAKIDEDGYFWIVGRNDDVIKVAGHRLGSAEIEHAIVAHPSVAEAAVIGKPHPVKGESIKAFVILKINHQPSEQTKIEINNLVRKEIGPIASLDEIEFVNSLPKTRSGKIMRRVLKAKELGLPLGDTSTLES